MRRLTALLVFPIAVVLSLATCTGAPTVPSNELTGGGPALLTSRTMVRLELSPDTARIALTGSQVFTVKATYSDSSTATDPGFFAWTAPGGWISNGTYASKGLPGTYKISARVAGGLADSSVVIIGNATPPPPPPPSAPTLTLASLKPTIVVGDSATLAWSSTNDTACTASGAWTGSRPLTSSVVIKPTVTTSYTLTCAGAGGSIARSVTETVTPVAPVAPTLTFNSGKPTIVAGDSASLNWASANATSCIASAGWTGTMTLAGSKMVKPSVTTTYTLVCVGTGGSIAKSVTETVTPVGSPPPAAPTLTLTSTKTSMVVGDSAALNWTSANATACTASAGWTGSKGLTGTTVVKPAVTTNYTLTCTGAGGSIAKTVTETVAPVTPPPAAPTLTLTSLKPIIVAGDSATLNWASTNATACTASAGWTGSKGLTGTAVVKPTVTTSYTLTCTGAGGSIAKSVTETVTPVAPVAPTLTFNSGKPTIVAGDSASLNWASANATSCTASAGWTGTMTLTGSAMVKPSVTTTYTLVCAGAGGSITKSVTETVTPVAPPPPPVGTLPHQPAGLNALVDEPWNVRTPSGWAGPCSGGCASHVSVVADATAPRSPSNVLQFTYQGVTGAGDGVGQLVKTWAGVKTLYVAFWFKHSTNWRNCDSGINKMVYFGNAAQNDNIINFEGGSVTVYQQNGINDHGRMGTGAPAAKGQWHLFEMVATIDGRLAQWVDGQSNGDRNDLRWQSSGFTAVDVDPIWGGGCSGSPAAGQTFEIDHLYISGK